MKNKQLFLLATLILAASMSAQAADYTTYLTTQRGFTEVTSMDDIVGDAGYYYILTAAETTDLIVGIGRYEGKPDWASEETKALRYKSASQDPVLDLTNFFTIERSGNYIGLRNVVYSADLFQTHNNAGFMYVNTFTDKTLDEWSYLIPTYQDGYWLFENGKYPMSSGDWACGYLGPWNNQVKDDEPMALNRKNTTGDEAGHYRLWRIAKAEYDALYKELKRIQLLSASTANPVDATWLITNPSFETGDETGWELIGKDTNGNDEFKTRDYGMSNKEGGYLMNAYQWWGSHLGVTQTVENVPSGEYTLTGVVCSWQGRNVYFAGNSTTVNTTGAGESNGIPVSLNVNVGVDSKLVVSAGSTTDWWTAGDNATDQDRQGFFKLDNVQLTCKQLYLNGVANPLPNDETTKLEVGKWYYFDCNFNTDYWLIGNLSDMVCSTDGMKIMSEVTTSAVSREMTLNKGRIYFKTTHSDATLKIVAKREIIESENSFTAVALNVDGLPKKILTIDLNADGPGEEGTKLISKYLASKGYDFIGCSEDFNYNGSLMESLNDSYSCGTIRSTLSASGLELSMIINGFRFDTDGLNLIWKNSTCTASNESWTQWTSMVETDGNQYVKKGFRHYDMTLGTNGPVIDVYILHMDAGDTNATSSRESQWRQLAADINNADASRPKLIIGDTNSRWTREDITVNFMQQLNKNLTASDVWVEFCRNGVYPTTDMGDLTDQSDPTNYTNYEIVDKIIYINPTVANTLQLVPQSFRIEQDYTYGTVNGTDDTTPLGDHRPVVVTFKYVKAGDVVATPVTLADQTDNSKAISDADGVLADVTLQDRTLFKDGAWNTLCLPFTMTADQVTAQLAPAALMELDTEANSTYEHATGLDGTTLYLNFKDAQSIEAGKPYIIKWDAASEHIVNPQFTAVTIANTPAADVISTDGTVTFQGTYAPVALAKDDKTNLYLDADNTLNWPNVDDFFVNAFRAYFHLSESAPARRFVLNFGNGVSTGIKLIDNTPFEAGAWYTLDGRKLQGEPKKRGIFIQNNRLRVKTQ